MTTLTGTIGSPVSCIVQHLLSVDSVTDKVDERIFGGALPPASGKFKSAITIRGADGLPDIDVEVMHSPRLELRCYGETDEEAEEIYYLVYAALNGKLGIQANDTLCKSIWMASKGTNLFDENVNKPYMLAFMDSIFQTEKVSTV